MDLSILNLNISLSFNIMHFTRSIILLKYSKKIILHYLSNKNYFVCFQFSFDHVRLNKKLQVEWITPYGDFPFVWNYKVIIHILNSKTHISKHFLPYWYDWWTLHNLRDITFPTSITTWNLHYLSLTWRKFRLF